MSVSPRSAWSSHIVARRSGVRWVGEKKWDFVWGERVVRKVCWAVCSGLLSMLVSIVLRFVSWMAVVTTLVVVVAGWCFCFCFVDFFLLFV